jgi:hypothetical protein
MNQWLVLKWWCVIYKAFDGRKGGMEDGEKECKKDCRMEGMWKSEERGVRGGRKESGVREE